MAIQSTDLLVIQDPTSSDFYKLKISDLDTHLQASDYIQFRGSVDLNLAPSGQTPALPAPINGDLYIVESDAATIASGWTMQGGVTEAFKNDRIIYVGDSSDWLIISSNDTGGTVTEVLTLLPLEHDTDKVTPELSILQARTTTAATDAADNKGTAGAVERLAETTDVVAINDNPSTTAVVTADLLNSTNKAITDINAEIVALETAIANLEAGQISAVDGGVYAP